MTTDRPPAVSVIIPTHNRAGGMLQRAVASVLDQTVRDLELLVVDDASTDGTQEYLGAVTDPRVRSVRHSTAKGGCAARNTGVAEARGRYVAFLDDDDIWLPGKLEAQLGSLEARNADFAYAGWRWVNSATGATVKERVPDSSGLIAGRPRWFFNCINDIVIRTELARETPFNEDTGLMYPNTDLLIRLAGTGKPAWSSGIVSDCFEHPGPRTSDSRKALADGIEYVLTTHREFLSAHSKERTDYLVRLGASRLGYEKRVSGLRHFARALSANPSDVRVWKHTAAATLRYFVRRPERNGSGGTGG